MIPLSRLLRYIAMMLIPMMLIDSVAFASSKPADPAAMKAKIQARGVGQGVRVSLADNTSANGLIVSISEQSFLLKVKGSPQPEEIPFAQITGVHNDKMGSGTKIIIVVAIVGATIGIIAAVFVHQFHAGFKNVTI